MVKRVRFLALSAIAVLSLGPSSCSSGLLDQERGTVTIQTAASPGSKALSDGWPMGGPPVFSSLTVAITDQAGSDMVLDGGVTVSGNAITVAVKPGSNLRVSIDAVPDWTATSTAYGVALATLPTLAKAYTGISAPITVEMGKNTATTVSLSLSETKILLPNPNGSLWQLGVADSITSAAQDYAVQMSGIDGYSTYLTFDRHGSVFLSRYDSVSASSVIEKYSSLKDAPTVLVSSANPFGAIALDIARNRLFYTESSDGFFIGYADFSVFPAVQVDVTLPAGYMAVVARPIAIDTEGYLYVQAQEDTPESARVLLKLSVGAPTEGSVEATVSASAQFKDLGLGYTDATAFIELGAEDYIVFDDALYIIARDVYAASYPGDLPQSKSRGKIVAVDTGTMSKAWEAGWSGDSAKYPTSNSSQFYGPTRFVGLAPKKLYIIDEGGVWDGVTYSGMGYSDVDRIVEVDVTGQSISGTGCTDMSSFFTDYSTISIC